MPEPTPSCQTCTRNPEAMNSDYAECSHVECPHRGRCWSDVRPGADGRSKPQIPATSDLEP